MSKRKLQNGAALDSLRSGMRVRLSENVLHPQYRGLPGIVEKTIKSRRMVAVRLDNGERYSAFPENVIIVEVPE
jgi:hypothetical protein